MKKLPDFRQLAKPDKDINRTLESIYLTISDIKRITEEELRAKHDSELARLRMENSQFLSDAEKFEQELKATHAALNQLMLKNKILLEEKNELLSLKKRNLGLENDLETYKKKYHEHRSYIADLILSNKKLSKEKVALLLQIDEVHKSLAVAKEEHSSEIEDIKKKHTEILEKTMIHSMDREIGLKRELGAAKEEAKRYSLALQAEKEKYKERERVLKTKLSSLIMSSSSQESSAQ